MKTSENITDSKVEWNVHTNMASVTAVIRIRAMATRITPMDEAEDHVEEDSGTMTRASWTRISRMRMHRVTPKMRAILPTKGCRFTIHRNPAGRNRQNIPERMSVRAAVQAAVNGIR